MLDVQCTMYDFIVSGWRLTGSGMAQQWKEFFPATQEHIVYPTLYNVKFRLMYDVRCKMYDFRASGCPYNQLLAD